jgi:K+ transporter
LFATMVRNARTAADYFNIPAAQVIEVGTKMEM